MTSPVETSDFEAFLAERGITLQNYRAAPEEIREYLLDVWRQEHHVLVSPQPAPEVPPVPETPVEREMPTAPSFMSFLPVVLGTVLLVSILVGAVAFLLSSRNRPAPPAPAPPIVTAPVVPSSEATWQIRGRADGPGTKRTGSFTIRGAKWRVNWVTRPNMEVGPDELNVMVMRPDGSRVGPAVRTWGESEGDAVFYSTGTFYLEARSTQRYIVRAYEYR